MINYDAYSIEENEQLYGPGKRLVIFLQGCSLHCKGCSNKQLWSFVENKIIREDDLIALLDECEGITILGGEPLDQSDNLCNLINMCKVARKTVVLFTGYLKKELTKKSQIYSRNHSDIVISGRFDIDKRNLKLQFRGSTNQKVYSHSGKYKGYKVHDGTTNTLLKFSSDGLLMERGFISDDIKSVLDELEINK